MCFDLLLLYVLNSFLAEISGSHGCKYEDNCLLGCDYTTQQPSRKLASYFVICLDLKKYKMHTAFCEVYRECSYDGKHAVKQLQPEQTS